MMGQQKSEGELFNCAVNLEKRGRRDHPFRSVAAATDFGLVRARKWLAATGAFPAFLIRWSAAFFPEKQTQKPRIGNMARRRRA